jgi:hypothetical protein
MISQNIKEGLNQALNEAEILGLDFNEARKTVYITFYPIAIQQNGQIPFDNRILFAFKNIGRIASSLTLNTGEPAIPFNPCQLASKIDEYKNASIYGWEFIDNKEGFFNEWRDNKSFDLIIDNDFNSQHTIDLFQEDKFSNKSIDIRIWFDYIEIFDSGLNAVDIQLFIDNGKRGWNKLYQDGWVTSENVVRDKLRII